MPTKKSEWVINQRKRNYDRVSVLIDKGGKYLLHTLAKREGVSVAEITRRAVLARAGLRVLPYPQELEALQHVTTQGEADQAIRRLQNHEESNEIINHIIEELSPEANSKNFSVSVDYADVWELKDAVKKITAAIDQNPPQPLDGDRVRVELSGREVGVLRRFLANIQAIV